MPSLLDKIFSGLISPFLSFLFILAIAYFIYGIVVFIAGASNEEARNKGKKHISWGLVGLLVMTSAYAIIKVVKNFIDSF